MNRAIFLKQICIVALFVSLGGCTENCTNTIIERADAPGGRFTALLFQRDCGATTAFSTQISVLEIGEELVGSGNAFRADGDGGKAPAGAWGGPWAKMQWLSPDHLLVRFASQSRIFAREEDAQGVTISYEATTGL